MSNLGMYQWFTTTAKKVGGPKVLIGLLLSAGYVSGKIIEIGGKRVFRLVKRKKVNNDEMVVYIVNQDTEIQEGVAVHKGDIINVVSRDKNALLIEIVGNDNNPYYIDDDYLRTIAEKYENQTGNDSK